MKIFEIIVILGNEHFRATLDLVVEQDPTPNFPKILIRAFRKPDPDPQHSLQGVLPAVLYEIYMRNQTIMVFH